MAHTLRRSKSKYGRTRRQRRNKKRISGGGFIADILNKFKPKSSEDKCKEAEQEAAKNCNSSSGAEGDIEMTELATEPSYDASVNGTSNNDVAAGFIPGVDGGDVEMTTTMPQPQTQSLKTSKDSNQANNNNDYKDESEIEQNPLQPQPLSQPPASKFSGGAKKSKKKNKKRSQSRRKKLKSRKHKK